jgi:hypothetical protein
MLSPAVTRVDESALRRRQFSWADQETLDARTSRDPEVSRREGGATQLRSGASAGIFRLDYWTLADFSVVILPAPRKGNRRFLTFRYGDFASTSATPISAYACLHKLGTA